MKAKTFLEIHDALINNKPLSQWTCDKFGCEDVKGLNAGLCLIEFGESDYIYIYNDYKLLWDNEIFKLFMPEDEEGPSTYWAGENDDRHEYNELRQTIILLCAAINGELDSHEDYLELNGAKV